MAKGRTIKYTNEHLFLTTLDAIIQPEKTNYTPQAAVIVGVSEPAVQTQYQSRKSHKRKNIIRTKNSTHSIGLSNIALKAEHQTAPITFIHNSFDEIESVRNGVKFKDFKPIYDLFKLSTKKWSEIIGVSEKTMQTILKEKKFLDQKKAEKLLSFLLLVKYGIEVFGTQKAFETWLNYASPVLKNIAPLDYLDTFQGIGLLKDLLYKIETGNLA